MSISRRIEALEEQFARREPTVNDSDWPLGDQLRDIVQCLRVHRPGGSKQLATDRQIHMAGVLCAIEAVGSEGIPGEHTFPSGRSVSFTGKSDGQLQVEASSLIPLEDLPDGVREYFERMDPDRQPERERWLYENWLKRRDRGESLR